MKKIIWIKLQEMFVCCSQLKPKFKVYAQIWGSCC